MTIRTQSNKIFRKRRAAGIASLILLFVFCAVFMIDHAVEKAGDRNIVSSDQLVSADCVIVPGALVIEDQPSPMLRDRLDTALKIYQSGVTNRILVSGDHGTPEYDEVNAMRQYLLDQGVPAEHIFMDHAGFDTYDTLYRAKEVFLVQKAIVVTQDFHLRRALFICEYLGLEVQGVSSDLRFYQRSIFDYLREYGARVKAFLECALLKPKPTYLGEVIPISGNGLDTVG